MFSKAVLSGLGGGGGHPVLRVNGPIETGAGE
jgi:hypothetical protein